MTKWTDKRAKFSLHHLGVLGFWGFGVLVHEQSGLLWPASLPGAFLCLLFDVSVEETHRFVL
jgi:hypothetical protein